MDANFVKTRRPKPCLTAVMVAVLLLAACTSSTRESNAAAPATTGRTNASGLTWRVRGGDAWTWRVAVSARCDCGGPCEGPVVTVGGTAAENVRARGDVLSAVVPLESGANQVHASCTTSDARQLSAPPLTFTERLAERPTARIGVSVASGVVKLDASASEPSHDARRMVSYGWRPADDNPGRLHLLGDGTKVRVRPSGPDGEYYVGLTVTDDRGVSDRAETYFVVQGGRPRAVDMRTENSAWVDDAVVYGVVPFLFGDNGFKSVERKLPYLRHLGINTIWLSPINRSPLGDYGYAVKDYFSLNPDYGTKAEFRDLVDAAHALGIRVLMDFVPNHTSEEHPYFVDAQEYGPASRYWDFYDRKPDGTYTHYFDWTYLPNLNYDNPEVRNMMLAAFSYWVRAFDVDGFRVDVAWGVKRRDPSFWPRWRAELKRIKPDLLLLAEGSARDPYYFTHGFDAAYDWTQHVGQWAWSGIFDSPSAIAPYVDAALTDLGHGYPKDALVLRFLNNNDTEERFTSRYGTDMTRVAAAMLLTLPGIPELFTGDEVGAAYLPYSDEVPISWEDQFNLRSYYRTLIQLRETWPALHSRAWQPLETSPTTTAYTYARFGNAGQTPALVVLNFGDRSTVEVTAVGRSSVFANARLADLLTGRSVRTAGSTLRIRMDALSARILVPKGARP
jgi:cyclomaltodextrinase